MNPFRNLVLLVCLIGLFCFALPQDCPAPLIWRRGEGWSFEREGVTTARTPQEQLDFARKLQAKKDYGNALVAYRRLIRRWPTAASAQEGRLGLAECLSGARYYYRSYKAYQDLIQKNPDSPYFDTATQREFEIANLFLGGQTHKMWPGLIRLPALDKALEIYEQLVKNGPYSKVGPDAQYRIGVCYEKQHDYLSAVHAFQKVLERYPQHRLAEDAQFQIAWDYKQESKRSEYDQNSADEAIAAFNDFLIRYPKSDKVPTAEQLLAGLKLEQAKGLFAIGRFYEKNRSYKAALIYYNAAIEKDPKSDWAAQAEQKVAALNSLAKPTPP